MNKGDLVEKIASECGINKSQASNAIESVIRTITAALKRGNRVTLSGFGSFTVYQRKARAGLNPQTGTLLQIPARRTAKFSPGTELKKAVSKK